MKREVENPLKFQSGNFLRFSRFKLRRAVKDLRKSQSFPLRKNVKNLKGIQLMKEVKKFSSKTCQLERSLKPRKIAGIPQEYWKAPDISSEERNKECLKYLK